MALNIRKDAVAQRASLLDIPCSQGETETLSRCIRLMHSHMAPPHPTIIPEVVIEVVIVYTKRDLCLLRCHLLGKCLK